MSENPNKSDNKTDTEKMFLETVEEMERIQAMPILKRVWNLGKYEELIKRAQVLLQNRR